MFPVEDGSKGRYNVLAEDVAELLADAEWTARYHESIALVAAAWGWDLERAAPIVPPQPVGQHRRLHRTRSLRTGLQPVVGCVVTPMPLAVADDDCAV